ncbi:MAG: glycosyltransferase family 39 protein [Victivallales bacterium]|jgi:hypothetical protein
MKEKPNSYYGFPRQREFHAFCSAALLLLVLTGFLHFWKIGEIPNGFFVDESLIGYSAWCIYETGADEFGTEYPVFHRNANSLFCTSPDPVVMHFLAPMVKVFGLEKWVVRGNCALFLLLASIAFYFLATKFVGNRWICLGGAFVFSILPWIFPLSRIGIGGHMHLLLGIIAGCYFLLDAVGRRSKVSAILAGVFCAFAMYSQNPGRPIVASLLVCFVLALNVLLIKRWKVFAVFIVTCVICLLPMINIALNSPDSMTSRFSTISVWSDNCGIFEVMLRILGRYIEYFSPVFLFISGDPILRHHTGESGELYIFMLPFIIAGLYSLYRGFKAKSYYRFLCFFLALYPLSAALTISHMHSTRAVNGAVLWSIVAVLGAEYIWGKRKDKTFKIMLYSFLAFSIFETSSYFANYFGKYVEKSRFEFIAPPIEAFEYAFENLKPGETLYVSSSVIPQKIDAEFKPLWYSYFLFFGKVPPEVYRKSGIPKDYVCMYSGKISKPGILIRNNFIEGRNKDGRIIAVDNPETIPENSSLIHKIPIMPNSKYCIEIYRF